jgi:hypothetical protein
MGFAQDNLNSGLAASNRAADSFAWWSYDALVGKEITIVSDADTSLQDIVNFVKNGPSNYVKNGSTYSVSSNASYNTSGVAELSYETAKTDSNLLDKVKDISASSLGAAELKTIFSWHVLTYKNIDTSNMRSNYSNSVLTLANVVKFIQNAEANLNVNGKFTNITGVAPSSVSSKWALFYVLNALGFSSAELFVNTTVTAAAFESIPAAADFNSRYSNALSGLSLGDRLTRKNTTSSTPLAVALQFVLNSENVATIVAALKSARGTGAGKVTDMSSPFTNKTAANLNLTEAEFIAINQKFSADELATLAAYHDLNKLPGSSKVATLGGDRNFTYDGIIEANITANQTTLVDLLGRCFRVVTNTSNVPGLIQLVVELGNSATISGTFPVGLKKANSGLVLASVPEILPEQLLLIQISNEVSDNNADAIAAVQSLSLASVLLSARGAWSNNQNPVCLYIYGAFKSAVAMKQFLPSLVDAINNGIYDGETEILSAEEVQTKVSDALNGEDLPEDTEETNDEAVVTSNTSTTVNSSSPTILAFVGQPLHFALMYYLLLNRDDVSASTIVSMYGANVEGKMSESMKGFLFSPAINLENVSFNILKPLLQHIGAAALQDAAPIASLVSGGIERFWPLAFFDTWKRYLKLAVAIGGFTNNEHILDVLSYVRRYRTVSSAGVYSSTTTDKIAVPLSFLTKVIEADSSEGVSSAEAQEALDAGVVAFSEEEVDSYLDTASTNGTNVYPF